VNALTEVENEPCFAAFVALDWGDKKHAWSLQASDAKKVERGELDHTPEAVEQWVTTLRMRFGGQPVALAVEQSRGALVFMLSKYDILHIYPVHPRSSAQFRGALHPSGAKDDPTDADVLLTMLTRHRSHLRRLNPDTVQTRLLQNLVEVRRKLVDERTAYSNQLTGLLKQYFPQILNWFDDVTAPVVGALLTRWSTLEQLQKVRPETFRAFLLEHNCRNRERNEQRLKEYGAAIPAIGDQAVIQTAVILTRTLVTLIATLREAIAELDRKIAEVSQEHPDYAIFRSFPGAGPVMAPRLLAAFGSQRERYCVAADIQNFSGIAPVTERSGKSKWVHFRWACPIFLRQSFHEWAEHSLGNCDWASIYYQQQRDRKLGHHAAVRALAFKWIRIAFRCWKDRVPYDDAIYVASLRRRRSPLAALLDAA
jgi:transposase